MSIAIRNIEREFSPSEAAAITGLSVDLQRDWRRRGLLPENKEGKWSRFSLADIVEMSVMKAFSDAGFSVSAVKDCAQLSILPTIDLLHQLPGAIAFDGDEISDSFKHRAAKNLVAGARGRYVIMLRSADGNSRALRGASLESLDKCLADAKAFHCTILDCQRLAKTIGERAGLPLMRIEIERGGGK